MRKIKYNFKKFAYLDLLITGKLNIKTESSNQANLITEKIKSLRGFSKAGNNENDKLWKDTLPEIIIGVDIDEINNCCKDRRTLVNCYKDCGWPDHYKNRPTITGKQFLDSLK